MNHKNVFISQLLAKKERLIEILNNYKKTVVLVVGDLTLDEFMTGEVERLSREAPVLILRHEQTKQIPGGGANAVYNMAKLGAKVKVAGLLGKDYQGEALCNIFARAGIDTSGIIWESDRPTVTKTRIAGHARQSVTQQIVRVDRKSEELPREELQRQLAQYIGAERGKVDAVVCSDYGDGVLTTPVIKAALSHQLVMVDTQKDLARYAGANLFTPNLPEAEQAVGYAIKDDQSLYQAGKDLLALTKAQNILITRGEEGMSLFAQNGAEIEASHIPAFNRTDVFDVTGAGDTVIAALTLSLCAGASLEEAAILGNLAASIVVRHFGTATTTIMEMKQALEKLIKPAMK